MQIMKNHIKLEQQLPELKAKNVDGKRFYEKQDGSRYPSITSVLSIKNNEGILAWRKRVGEEVANYVSIKAANRGTYVHNMVEDYLNNLPTNELEDKHKKKFLAYTMFTVLKDKLKHIDNIHLQEAQMYSDKWTVAGRCDCIAEYEGELSVIDFKTSTSEKKEDWIENYFIQGTAYAEMYEEHFHKPINQIVILIVTEEGTTQVFKKDKKEFLPKLEESVKQFYDWIEKNGKSN
jgi:genome maintenance exonuclease 1